MPLTLRHRNRAGSSPARVASKTWKRGPLRTAGTIALLLVAVLLPAVPTFIRIQTVFGDEPSFGDLATEEMATLEAAHGERRLGQWSRYDFFQPGPAPFYFLVPAYVASGYRAYGLSVGCFLLNWLCIVALVVLCSRWLERCSGLLLMLPMLVAVLGYLRTGGAHLVFNWWNAFMIALPFAVLLLLGAAVAAGQAEVLPWLVGVGSFIAQTQMAALPAALAVTVASLAFLVRDRRAAASSHQARPLGPFLASGLVLGLFWFLPFLDEARRAPGNMERIVSFLRQPHVLQTPLDTLRPVVQSLAAPIAHLAFGVSWQNDFRGLPLRVAAALAAIVVLGLLVADVLARRRGSVRSARLCEMCLLALGMALWSVWQIQGPLSCRYLFVWLALLGVVSWVAVGNEVGCALLRRARPAGETENRRAWLVGSLLAAGLALVLIAPEPRALGLPSTAPLSRTVREFLRGRSPDAGPIRLEAVGLTWPWATAIAPGLHRDGRRPCFDAGSWITDWWACREATATIRFTPEPSPEKRNGHRVGCQAIDPPWEGISVICVDFIPSGSGARAEGGGRGQGRGGDLRLLPLGTADEDQVRVGNPQEVVPDVRRDVTELSGRESDEIVSAPDVPATVAGEQPSGAS